MKIEDIIFYESKTFTDEDGSLSVFERNSDIPFEIQRIFYVYGAPENVVRGKHAHKETKQFFICLKGSCEMLFDDGENKKKFTLNSCNKAVLVPEGIWGEETYLEKDTILLVLCNTKYDDGDYLKDYNEFVEWKKY